MTEQVKLPYLTYPTKAEKYFNRIKEVEVPDPKFTYDFLENVMLFKSNNDRYLVSLLKKMGFLEQDGRPTELYKNYRNESESKNILAKGIKNAYSEIFRRNKNLHELDEEAITGYVKSATGQGDESSTLTITTKTIMNLIAMADFTEKVEDEVVEEVKKDGEEDGKKITATINDKLNLNYTISINLPETTNEEIYEKIFNSIKKTLLTK